MSSKASKKKISLVDNRTINVSSEEQFKSIKQLDSILLHLSKQNIEVYSKLLDLQFDKREEYMQQSNKFSEVSQTSMEEVENNPEKFIMTECIPACKELWSKNIYTFMVSNYIGENGIWIEIYDEISDENYARIKAGLRKVVTNGTAAYYMDKKYNASGKTGTSETFYGGANTYTKSFIAYFPSDDPKYALTIISPNISYKNSTSNYKYPINSKLSRKIANILFEN